MAPASALRIAHDAAVAEAPAHKAPILPFPQKPEPKAAPVPTEWQLRNIETSKQQYAIQSAILKYNQDNGIRIEQYNPPAHFSARFMYNTPKFA